nr:trafficking protein particle complex subunit 10 [Hymenolepis microstoma]
MNLENRPIIYYYGEDSATEHVKEFQSSVFSAEPVQWSRLSRDPPQTVHVDPNFLPLNISSSKSNGMTVPSSYPAVYIFLCPNDPDYYSNKGKQAFGHWISFITKHYIKEWLVIIITDKSKKIAFKNSIMTKLKHDFSINFTDRLYDLPSDYENLPGTIQNLYARLRSAVIREFNNTLDEMDQKSASLLQSCHEKDWDFMEYYLCLEEIASLHSCMSLYDEALECMEKADNFLTDELTRAAEKGITKWVKNLLSNSCDRLVNDPTIISTYANPERVEAVRQKKANLFELRSHILTRECALLQALDRISELPHRAVRMIRLCTKEARDLRIPIPEFQLHFWIFLTSLQTLDMFRRGTHCAPKTEDFINLRRKFLLASNLLQQSDEVLNETFLVTGYNSGHMNTEEDSNFPSNSSESNVSTLLSARFKALESLDLLEDISLQTEGTFNILARAVLASVVADDQVKCGRGAAQNQDLVGTSKWTVDLWRRACIALSHLGRLADLWPDPGRRMTRGIRPDTYNGAMLISIMNMFNNSASRNADTQLSGRISFGGSFGAQISIAFVSSSAFEESYRKFAGACIFFLSCSGAKRGAISTSLELADFFRDGGNFLEAEALYHQATKIFLKESWMELATYSLLQQAFCQYVQWSTENVDSIEASVFRRYVQTVLILAIIPSSNLNPCYELLKRRGAYIASFFEEDAVDIYGSSSDKVKILAPWWPEDWWAHALETVAEHYARITSPSLTPSSEKLSLHRPFEPLSVQSLWPLFRLYAIDLEEANPYTHRQVIRLHLRLFGARPLLVQVSVCGRPTTTKDWNEPPLSKCQNTKQDSDSVRLFNVDLNSEGIRSGILATKSDFSLNLSKELGESVDVRQSAYHRSSTPSPTNVSNSSFLGVSGSKESVIQRFFRRSSTRGRSGHQFFKRSAVNSNDTKEESRSARRPTSIDFQSFRGRLNTLEKVNPLPCDSILDGLTLSAG